MALLTTQPTKIWTIRPPLSVTSHASFHFSGEIGWTTNVKIQESCEPRSDAAWGVTQHLLDGRQTSAAVGSCAAKTMEGHFGGWNESERASENLLVGLKIWAQIKDAEQMARDPDFTDGEDTDSGED